MAAKKSWVSRTHFMSYHMNGSDFGIRDVLRMDLENALELELGIRSYEILDCSLMDYKIRFTLSAHPSTHSKIKKGENFS